MISSMLADILFRKEPPGISLIGPRRAYRAADGILRAGYRKQILNKPLAFVKRGF